MRLIEALIDNGWTLTWWRQANGTHWMRLHKGDVIIHNQALLLAPLDEQLEDVEAEYVREILGHGFAPDPAPITP